MSHFRSDPRSPLLATPEGRAQHRRDMTTGTIGLIALAAGVITVAVLVPLLIPIAAGFLLTGWLISSLQPSQPEESPWAKARAEQAKQERAHYRRYHRVYTDARSRDSWTGL